MSEHGNEGDESAAQQISRVAVKFLPFWDKEADLWFINIEAQFIWNGITQDFTKYYAVVSALNSEVLSYVSDIVKNPPTTDLYQTLKTRLIAEFADSEQKRVKDLLLHAVLGNEKPSHLLRKMRQLVNDKVSEEFLKTLWIQRLLKETQAILSVSDGSLDKLAQMADKIIDLSAAQVEETQRHPDRGTEQPSVLDLQAQVTALTEQVNRLSRLSYQTDGNIRDKSMHKRRRSQTPGRRNDSLCWYHRTFADKAKHCRSPCSYARSEN
ncbi:hypothetical protein AVEN_40157-1 [Araneus ventricosus]|uniref:DUF7041 domain-containing protein n=1 Tax=Araneus ventricosus TaxID=182803 RepID=A0A4Y2I834_ARAVE|nr:hypothetical protein AVEN_40157-1 [Araneus ventricosus]